MDTMDTWDGPEPDEAARAKARLVAMLEASDTGQKLAAFYAPERNYAGATFHTLPPLPDTAERDDITTADLLAITLMDVAVHPAAVRRFLDPGEPRNGVLAALRRVPLGLELATATPSELDAAATFYQRVKDTLGGNKWVTASKIAARKRPTLIPVRDSVVVEQLGLTNRDFRSDWATFRALVRDGDVVDGVRTVARRAVQEHQVELDDVPLLRLIDTIVWMHPRPLDREPPEPERGD